MELADPDGLWARAALTRIDVYGADARCSGGSVAPGAGAPITSRSFSPSQNIVLELTPGRYAIVLTLYADAAGARPLGGACSMGGFGASSSPCLALALAATPDGGACSICPPGSYCAVGTCIPGCAADVDCLGQDAGPTPTCCDHRCVDTD